MSVSSHHCQPSLAFQHTKRKKLDKGDPTHCEAIFSFLILLCRWTKHSKDLRTPWTPFRSNGCCHVQCTLLQPSFPYCISDPLIIFFSFFIYFRKLFLFQNKEFQPAQLFLLWKPFHPMHLVIVAFL